MRIKGAMTVLNKRAEFYGIDLETLILQIEVGFDETVKVLQAYEVYMRDKGYRWSGINGERWVK